MVLTVKLLDVASGLTEGVRSLQCNQCSEEDLPRAVSTLAGSVVKK